MRFSTSILCYMLWYVSSYGDPNFGGRHESKEMINILDK